MTILSLVVCMAMGWKLLGGSAPSILATNIARFVPRTSLVRACALALVPLYAAQLALVFWQSRLENAGPHAWFATLPIAVFDGRFPIEPLQAYFDTLGLGLGLAQSAALAVVFLGLRGGANALETSALAALACGLAGLSLAAPAMATTDPYEYAATGLLGFHAYAPQPGAFLGTVYAPYAQHIPLRPVIYGPLWLAIDIAQTHFASSVYAKIEAIRIANVAFVGGFLWLLARARSGRPALAACALNPALWYYGVANPHADIQGLVLLGAAYVFALRSRALPAAAFVMAAGFIKVPFVIVGGALLAPLPQRRRRVALWLAAIACVFVVSYLVQNRTYVRDLSRFAAAGARSNWSQEWLLLAPLSVCATAALVAFRRSVFGVAWLFHQFAPLAAPWYLFWGIPYALASRSFALYLVALPFAATLTEVRGVPSEIVVVAVAVVFALDIVRTRRVRALAN